MCDLQVAVMILSLGFIAFVTLLHIVGKVTFEIKVKMSAMHATDPPIRVSCYSILTALCPAVAREVKRWIRCVNQQAI